MVRQMRVLVTIVTLTLGGLLLLSFGGALHPAGDSFAVFRVPLAACLALLVIWSPWSRWLRWPVALLCLAVMAQVVVPRFLPNPTVTPDFVLYQQNLLFRREGTADFARVLRNSGADMVTLQEVSQPNVALLEEIADILPHQLICPMGSVGGVAIASRYAFEDSTRMCEGDAGLAAARLQTPHGPVWLVSIHLHWPWPYRQAWEVGVLEPFLEQMDGHVIMAGDFNSVAWSDAVARMGAAARAERVGPLMTTFRLPPLGYPIGIDHVLTGRTGPQAAFVQPQNGSDHHGILAHLKAPGR